MATAGAGAGGAAMCWRRMLMEASCSYNMLCSYMY